jgi:hypothetical protein
MVQSILWPDPRMNEFRTPFQRGEKERNLRVTLHIESFEGVTGISKVAYSTIRELGNQAEIETYSTQKDIFPWIEIQDEPARNGYKRIRVWQDENPILHSGVHQSRYSQRHIQMITGYYSDDEIIKSAENVILIAEVHHALRRDILVTMSPILLEHRDNLGYSNIFSPIEAAKLIGLFLRCRNNLVGRVGGITVLIDKGLFYWMLARSKLPAMWRYNSGCGYAKKTHGDEISMLGQSVLVRCKRIMQARDAIAEQFHQTQNNNTQDEIMYHFDYVTLLLVGVFDAQAKITNYVYDLGKKKGGIGFQKDNFLKALGKSKAKDLFQLVKSNHCKHLITMLHTIRNTIHNAGLHTYTLIGFTDAAQSLVSVPDNMQEALWETSQILGSPSEWGLVREEYKMIDGETKAEVPKVRISLEPYSYVTKLIEVWFELFNQIAERTAIEDLFTEEDMPELKDEPPDDLKLQIERFEILG